MTQSQSTPLSSACPDRIPRLSSGLPCRRKGGFNAFALRRSSMLLIVVTMISAQSASASFVTIQGRHHSSCNALQAAASSSPDGADINLQLERAKKLIAKSKAKIEANGDLLTTSTTNGEEKKKNGNNVPFFAAKRQRSSTEKKAQVIKSLDESTGLFTTDGEKMAEMSEKEEWESRSLLEVFDNEIEESTGGTAGLYERDVAASIFNLRKQLRQEDYKKIFDTNNRFIGEDN